MIFLGSEVQKSVSARGEGLSASSIPIVNSIYFLISMFFLCMTYFIYSIHVFICATLNNLIRQIDF